MKQRFPILISNIESGDDFKKIISVVISFLMLFPSYLFSLMPGNIDTEFEISAIEPVAVSVIENGIVSDKAEFSFNEKCGWFNYYGISYKSDAYMKGTVTYVIRGGDYTEEFFLEPDDGKKPFYSFIDGVLDKTKSNTLCKITIEPLDKETAEFTLLGVDVTTSYIAAVEYKEFSSFKPMEYNYYISTGTTSEMRANFNEVR